MTVLNLILGDQLDPCHSSVATVRPDIVHVLMEVRSETDYVRHHAQKVIAIFAAMRALAAQLREAGHRVHYLTLDDSDNRQAIPANLDALIARYQAVAVQHRPADEYRLDRQLADWAETASVPVTVLPDEHFYTTRDEAAQLFKGRKQWLMEHFYRSLRVKHGVLLTPEGGPEGGQWNFDHDNRKSWNGQPPEPSDRRPHHDHSALWAMIQAAGVNTFGDPQADDFRWPLNRAEALAQLDDFIARMLPHFGDFQDAISVKARRLFHALISFALNVKLLSPREVVQAVEAAWRAGQAPLAACEGFIRQILGWREYVRGIYWAQMPGYDQRNHFDHRLPLPHWFWDGDIGMRCLASAVGQSLEMAYAHHIQRLMVIGNFSLLAGLDPHALHQWYLGVYIDAFEWVELPNTLGMSQFGDGGLLATKPYVSSAAYIDRMGDTCKGCRYDRKARLGPDACPFNALYWDFHLRHADTLSRNPRIGMVYRNIARMKPEEVVAIRAQADSVRARLETL